MLINFLAMAIVMTLLAKYKPRMGIILPVFAFTIIALTLPMGHAFASSVSSSTSTTTPDTGIFDNGMSRLCTAYTYGKKAFFLLAALAAICMAVMAAFGKMKWQWFWYLVLGVFIVGFIAGLLSYLNVVDTSSCTTTST